jgi:hypothetical protein
MIRNNNLHNRLWGLPLAIFSRRLLDLLLAILNNLHNPQWGLLLAIFSNLLRDPLLAMGNRQRDPLPATGNRLYSRPGPLLTTYSSLIIVCQSRRLISSTTRPHHCRQNRIILT